MTVSIIIPCYNQAHFLPDAIESALKQTYQDIEIIVVNDGSPDNTSEVAKRYDIKLIEQKNKGLSGARNTGIKAAKGEYIVTLDSDDKLHPDFITKTIGLDDIVSTGLQTFGNENRKWITNIEHPTHQHFLQKNHINCCSLFRKQVWKDIKGYDEKMKDGFEDWDFWTRATGNGATVTVVPDVLFYYRKHSVSMFAEAQRKRQNIIDYMRTKYSATGKLIDVVYCLGTGSISSDNEIRYSLRSLEKYVTGWRNIYVVGECPVFLKDVKHIPFKEGCVKALNILNKIKKACEDPDLSDDFLFVNDDHFFLCDVDAVTYPYYYNNDEMMQIMNNRPNMDNYRRIVSETMAKCPGMNYYDIHKPIVYNKDKFLKMCENIDFASHELGLLIKSTYCMYNDVQGTYGHDNILRNKHTLSEIEDRTLFNDILSIHDDAINADLVKWFGLNYPVRSRFEK